MQLEEFFRNIATVTMKLTMGCNLKCSYCNTETVTPQTPMMSAELYKKVARLLLENSNSRYVTLEYHGGEPMLLSDEWFEETSTFAFSLARQHGKDLQLPMVTNGTLLTEERLLKLHKLGVRFCLSCDGPPEVNDLLRGGGRAVERAIRLCRKHKIHLGIMTVMSRANYHRMTEVMDWFRDLGIRDFSVNAVQPQGRGLDSELLSGEQMFEGMRQILDHMDTTNVSVHEADVARFVERFVEGREASPTPTCWEFECQAGKQYMAVDLFGRMHACGSDMANHVIGHIEQEFDEQHYRRKMAALHAKSDWVIRCFDCAASRICNHSCPTSDFNNMQAKENECRFTKLLWAHLCENSDQAYRVYERTRWHRGPRPQNFVSLADVGFAKPVLTA